MNNLTEFCLFHMFQRPKAKPSLVFRDDPNVPGGSKPDEVAEAKGDMSTAGMSDEITPVKTSMLAGGMPAEMPQANVPNLGCDAGDGGGPSTSQTPCRVHPCDDTASDSDCSSVSGNSGMDNESEPSCTNAVKLRIIHLTTLANKMLSDSEQQFCSVAVKCEKGDNYVVHCGACDIHVAVGSFNQKLSNFKRHLMSSSHSANMSRFGATEDGAQLENTFKTLAAKWPNVFSHVGELAICSVCGPDTSICLKYGSLKTVTNAERHIMSRSHQSLLKRSTPKITGFFQPCKPQTPQETQSSDSSPQPVEI